MYIVYVIISSLIRLPSTFLHEIAHVIVALILGGRVGRFSLIPEIRENGSISFGEVLIGARYPGVFFAIGLAPTVWIATAYLIYHTNTVIVNKPITFIVLIYLIGAGIPSYQDILVAVKGLSSISGIIIAVCTGITAGIYLFILQ